MNYHFRLLFIAAVVLFVAPHAGANQHEGLTNQLNGHPSAYLALHSNDPTAWQEWNQEAFERARREDKLLFVSSGYFSCHWCHTMQRESYQDDEIADILNKHFIPVKVDRELNPALDARLVDFLERTRGVAGWPLNVFITPDGYPLIGMLYLPKKDFKRVLIKISTKWDSNKGKLKRLALRATDELGYSYVARDSRIKEGIGELYLHGLVSQALEQADHEQGGFGAKNKFPSVPQMLVLLQAYQRQPTAELKTFLALPQIRWVG